MTKLQTIFLCILMTFSAIVFAKGDISNDYLLTKKMIQNNSFDNTQLKLFLKNKTVLLVPGVLSQSFSSTSRQIIKVNLIMGEIFNDHVEWLVENNINFQKIELESEASPKENANYIIDTLEKLPQNVIVFAHSKGGLDTFSALSKRPDLLGKISGLITAQTPFHGSPVAESFSNLSITRSLGKWFFSFLGGSEEGMTSLSESSSKRRNEEYKKQYQTITEKVPVINFGSYKIDTKGWDSALELFRDFTEVSRGPNDGVVPLTSAYINNTYQVTEADVDHLLLVTNCKGIKKFSFNSKLEYTNMWSYNRKAHFESLLESLRKVSITKVKR